MDYKAIRKLRGWSQFQTAKELGISINTWIQWERGVSKPNKENMEMLKEAFSNELAILQTRKGGE